MPRTGRERPSSPPRSVSDEPATKLPFGRRKKQHWTLSDFMGSASLTDSGETSSSLERRRRRRNRVVARDDLCDDDDGRWPWETPWDDTRATPWGDHTRADEEDDDDDADAAKEAYGGGPSRSNTSTTTTTTTSKESTSSAGGPPPPSGGGGGGTRPLSSSNLAESRESDAIEASLFGAIAACKRQRQDADSQIEAYRARLAALVRQRPDEVEPYSSFPALVAFQPERGVYYDLLQVSSSATLEKRTVTVDADPCAAIEARRRDDQANDDVSWPGDSSQEKKKPASAPAAAAAAPAPEKKPSSRTTPRKRHAMSFTLSTTTPQNGASQQASPSSSSSQQQQKDASNAGSWLVACVARRRSRRLVRLVAVVATVILALASFVLFCFDPPLMLWVQSSSGWLAPAATTAPERRQEKIFLKEPAAERPPPKKGGRLAPTEPDQELFWQPTEDQKVAVVSSNFGNVDVLSTAPRQHGSRQVSFFLFTRHRDFLAVKWGWTLVLPTRMALSKDLPSQSSPQSSSPQPAKGGRKQHRRGRAAGRPASSRLLSKVQQKKNATDEDAVAEEDPAAGTPTSTLAALRTSTHDRHQSAPPPSSSRRSAPPSVVYSASWDAALARIESGKRKGGIATGAYPPSSRQLVSLPFDLESLEHTRHHGIGREYDEAQNLVDVMAPKFVKLQMFKIDVLMPYDYLVWADASLVFDGSAVSRAMRPLLRHSADLVVQPHPKRNSTFQELKHILQVQSQERFVPIAPYLEAQMEHYSSNATGFDDANGLYWMAYFSAKRSNRTVEFFDRWWLEVRRWQYRDQVSVMFALHSIPKERRPKVTTFEVDGKCCKANGKKTPAGASPLHHPRRRRPQVLPPLHAQGHRRGHLHRPTDRQRPRQHLLLLLVLLEDHHHHHHHLRGQRLHRPSPAALATKGTERKRTDEHPPSVSHSFPPFPPFPLFPLDSMKKKPLSFFFLPSLRPSSHHSHSPSSVSHHSSSSSSRARESHPPSAKNKQSSPLTARPPSDALHWTPPPPSFRKHHHQKTGLQPTDRPRGCAPFCRPFHKAPHRTLRRRPKRHDRGSVRP